MATEEELERTFLAKFLPEDLEEFEFVDLEDNYIPRESRHPLLRIRKKGDQTVITKKSIKSGNNTSVMIEETIPLSLEEYTSLNKLEGKKFSKKRYSYEYDKGRFCEIDIYQDALKGLVVIDFEFKNLQEKEDLVAPDFCLVEVTGKEFLAGGMLCGKNYEDLESGLNELKYNKI